jgi:hypothetical protein
LETVIGPANRSLLALQKWQSDTESTREQKLNNHNRSMMELRILGVNMILSSWSLFCLLYGEKEPLGGFLPLLESLLWPSTTFIECVLSHSRKTSESGTRNEHPPRFLSLFKVQYEWAIRVVVEAMSVCIKRGYGGSIVNLLGLYKEVLDNQCNYLKISEYGMKFLIAWYEKTFDRDFKELQGS